MLAYIFQTGPLTSSFRHPSRARTLSKPPIPSKLTYPKKCRPLCTASRPSSATSPPPTPTDSIAPLLNSGLGVIVLKAGKAHLFRDQRNPMVFSGAIDRTISSPTLPLSQASPVAIVDPNFAPLAFGFFNPASLFRVRLLRHFSTPPLALAALPWQFESDISQRLADAFSLRSALSLPVPQTDVFRLVNGDGDRLSGFILDKIGPTLVVSSSAMWCEHYKPHILRAISSLMPACPDIIWRTNLERLRQDGLIEPPTTAPAPEHPAVAPIVREDAADIVVQECGVKFFISRFALTKGQKTGHYADQRENRAFLRLFLQQKASPARVLDLFCYTGGFALSAALAHHENQVVGVDSSARAIDTARRNAELNGVEKQVEFIQGDVVKVIRSQEERSYDVVIVDPPKFAPNVKALKRATYKYQSLNMQAIRMLKVGGLLFTCTCSAAMTKDRAYFIDVVRCAAREVGRELTLVKTFGAATDHPIAPEMLELEYLTVCLFVCR